jgi:hypothetical protein
MQITKIIVSALVVFICWDVVTTYYGAVSSFTSDYSGDVMQTLSNATTVQHVTSILIASMLIILILCYKKIFIAKNKITLGLLYVGFALDFVTSLYGTASATNSIATGGNALSWILVVFLSLGATSAPLLIHQVLEGEE